MIGALATLFLSKRRKKNQRRRRTKKRATRPVRRVRPLAANGDYLKNLLGSTQTGAKKMQFPYELPTIVVETSAETNKTIITAAAILGGGIAVAGIATAVNRQRKYNG